MSARDDELVQIRALAIELAERCSALIGMSGSSSDPAIAPTHDTIVPIGKAASRLKVSPRTARQWLKAGVFRLGNGEKGRLVVYASFLDSWIAERKRAR